MQPSVRVSVQINKNKNNLDWLFSDHRPIEMELERESRKENKRHRKPFRFEELWITYDECGVIISKNGHWKGNEINSLPIVRNVKNCSDALLPWGKNLNMSRKNKIKECKKNLKETYENLSNIDFDSIHNIEFELEKLLEEEEIYWKQRSREN